MPISVAHPISWATNWPGIAIEQPGDVAVHAVPAPAVVALAVGEQTDRNHTP